MNRYAVVLLLILAVSNSAAAQTLKATPAANAISEVDAMRSAVLQALQDEEIPQALKALEGIPVMSLRNPRVFQLILRYDGG